MEPALSQTQAAVAELVERFALNVDACRGGVRAGRAEGGCQPRRTG